jgi:hypothetical protein
VAVLVFAQTLLVLGVVALLEQHPLPRPGEPADAPAGAAAAVEPTRPSGELAQRL